MEAEKIEKLEKALSGFELIQADVAKALANRDIPVIFVTAMDAPENEQRGLELGAVD